MLWVFQTLRERSPIAIIANKEISDAVRDRFIPIITAFLVVAALVSPIASAVALATDVATYDQAHATLLALGKSAATIAVPEFYPLKLLRGAIEQIEIIAAAVVILIGHRAAASERGRQKLSLIHRRPVGRWQFLAGKVGAGLFLLGTGLVASLVVCSVALHLVSGVGLTLADLGPMAIIWVAALAYMSCFFPAAVILTLTMRRPPHALLAAFCLGLMLVLIAP